MLQRYTELSCFNTVPLWEWSKSITVRRTKRSIISVIREPVSYLSPCPRQELPFKARTTPLLKVMNGSKHPLQNLDIRMDLLLTIAILTGIIVLLHHFSTPCTRILCDLIHSDETSKPRKENKSSLQTTDFCSTRLPFASKVTLQVHKTVVLLLPADDLHSI